MTDPNFRTGFALIGSFEHVFEAMFGPQQHDAHVKAGRAEMWLRSREAGRAERANAVWAAVAEINAEHRARCARMREASAAALSAHHKIAAE